MSAALLIAVMSVVTILLRALPFLIFRKETPAYITYLGRVLPPAIIGMLVIYCLKDVSLTASPWPAWQGCRPGNGIPWSVSWSGRWFICS